MRSNRQQETTVQPNGCRRRHATDAEVTEGRKRQCGRSHHMLEASDASRAVTWSRPDLFLQRIDPGLRATAGVIRGHSQRLQPAIGKV